MYWEFKPPNKIGRRHYLKNDFTQNIRFKLQDLKDIDQKIIEVIQPSDIETDIIGAEEYALNIDIEISDLEDFRRSQGFFISSC